MRTIFVLLSAASLALGAAETFPAFRGDGLGTTNHGNLPTSWSVADSTNVKWTAEMPIQSWASPVIADGKVITLAADIENQHVLCYDLDSGNQLWNTAVPKVEGATEDYLVDSMDERWDTLLYAGCTPAIVGDKVIAAFSIGQICCVDLASGEVVWNNPLGSTAYNTYGLTNSLVPYKDTVILAFEGDKEWIAAYDVATGEEKWKSDRASATWASPILITTKKGADQIVLPADPDVTAWDPATGEQLWSVEVLTGGPEWCVGPTPVYGDGLVFTNCENCGIYAIDPDKGELVWSIEEMPDGTGFPDGTCMVTDGKILYQFFPEVLAAIDCKTGDFIKTKEMDVVASYASPHLDAGKLYLMGQSGVQVVNADPASDFATIGTGDFNGMCDASPAVVSGHIVFREDDFLTCIGK
jgi:outer membrane protein assembly factor BamB